MILNDYKNELVELLYQACVTDIHRLRNDTGDEKIIAWVIVCDSAYINFGTALCTEQRLHTQADILMATLPEQWFNRNKTLLYVQTHAAEWNRFNNVGDFQEFNTLANFIAEADCNSELSGIYREGDISDNDIFHRFYEEMISDVISRLALSDAFITPPFHKDLLSGLQFFAPTAMQQKIMLNISKKVNSTYWLNQMIKSWHQDSEC